MKKTVIGLVAMASLMCAGQASADLASSLSGYQGPLYFDLSGYTQSLTGGETWGVITVNGVFNSDEMTVANRLWGSSPTDQTYGTFYGLTDNYSTQTATGFSIGQQGGGFTLYAVDGDVDLMQGPGGRILVDGYTGMGTNVLFKGNFDSGVDPNNAFVTVIQTVLNQSSPTVGQGVGYGSVLSGSLYNLLNSNSIVDSSFGQHDLSFAFDVKLPSIDAVKAGWDQAIFDPMVANAVPEPATMLLFGAGMMGLAFVGRRIRK